MTNRQNNINLQANKSTMDELKKYGVFYSSKQKCFSSSNLRSSFDSYMTSVFKDVVNGKTVSAMAFKEIIDVYTPLISELEFKHGIYLSDIIFSTKFCKPQHGLRFLTSMIYRIPQFPMPFRDKLLFPGVYENLQKISKYVHDHVNDNNRELIFYIPVVVITRGSSWGHQYTMIVDTSRKPFRIFFMNPYGITLYDRLVLTEGRINNFLKSKCPEFTFKGLISQYMPLDGLMKIQTRLSDKNILCVVLAVFQTYLLSRYDTTKFIKILNREKRSDSILSYIFSKNRNKNNAIEIDSKSLLAQYESMSLPQQRYVVARFIERIFNISIKRVDRDGKYTRSLKRPMKNMRMKNVVKKSYVNRKSILTQIVRKYPSNI